MNCNIVKDLIPLYIDGCCSEESEKAVEQHIQNCADCKKLLDDMKSPSDTVTAFETPKTFSKLNDWKASVLQSVLLFVSFGLITVGVALEARTPSGIGNGFVAFNLVVPATGFMLSMANWYFIRVYQNRKIFSNVSWMITLGITVCAYIWANFHYETGFLTWFSNYTFANFLEAIPALFLLHCGGLLLTMASCIGSKMLSNQYAKMLGKE